MFLRVTDGDEEEKRGDVAADNDEVVAGADVVHSVELNKINAFKPNLNWKSQAWTLYRDFWTRSWAWRNAKGNIVVYGVLLVGVLLLGLGKSLFWVVCRDVGSDQLSSFQLSKKFIVLQVSHKVRILRSRSPLSSYLWPCC